MFFQGLLLGLSLSFLVGPLLFSVVQAGIGQGFRAGLAVAAGIWVSDLLFVAAILWGVETLAALTALKGFRLWAGILGGLLLIVFGGASYFSKRKQAIPASQIQSNNPRPAYIHLWIRGFLINTVNPGTIFFWLGIISAVVVPNGWNKRETLTFFAGMLGTLVVTDVLKAWAAKGIGRWLTGEHIRQLQKGIGLVLIVFGIVLIFKALVGGN